MTVVRMRAFTAAVLSLAAAPALAQPAPPAPLATPNPTYVSIVLEQEVARPAAEVWKRIGGFCDIQTWFPGARCQISSGKEGELGAVRTLNGSILEIMVGKTDLSYTYTQPVRVGQAYNLYHGTLEARPVTATTSKLVYSLVLDNSMLAGDAARKADLDSSRAITTRALGNMKILAEGGTLPPPGPGPRR
ncbi:MAG: SRPBCC family protein [Caulobacteraceae bacterium]